MFFRFFKAKPKTPAEEKLQKIIEMLFPPLKLDESKGVKFYIDSSVDSNLDAALNDLEDGNNDEISRKTIRKVSNRLFNLRKYLEVTHSFDSSIETIVIEDLDTNNLEEIDVAE